MIRLSNVLFFNSAYNKRYMKLCYIKELTTCNVASVSLRDTLINVTVANRDIFDL